jgi:very-short-patch-repair endonuclease
MKPRLSKRQKNQKRIGKIAESRRARLARTATRSELAFASILKKYQIPIKFQKIVFLPDMFYILDFFFGGGNGKGIIFEIDGLTHNAIYDQKRDRAILKLKNYRKCRIIRIKNYQVFNGEAEILVRQLFPKFIKKYT